MNLRAAIHQQTSTPQFLLTAVMLFLPTAAMGADNQQEDPQRRITLEQLEGKIRVTIGGQLFSEYDYTTYAKPILYPVLGPDQVPMTRDYPMKKGVGGQASDHPHHKSIWFAHGDVNGISFWHEQGRIVHNRIVAIDNDATRPSVTTNNAWVTQDKKTVCTDTTRVAFLSVPGGRAIDIDVTLHASHGDVRLGDTKEGTMGIRTHPNLRLSNAVRHGVTSANGQAVNSKGDTGKPVWGKPAKWIDYYGIVGDHVVGIAIFDHPGNLRHPTTWHAREYGLVAANPFGLSHFLKREKGAGDYVIRSGEDRSFRYRFVFHKGDPQRARIEELFQAYAAESAE